jgi:hypothetical protein
VRFVKQNTPPYTASKSKKAKHGFSSAPIVVTSKKPTPITVMGELGRAIDTDFGK